MDQMRALKKDVAKRIMKCVMENYLEESYEYKDYNVVEILQECEISLLFDIYGTLHFHHKLHRGNNNFMYNTGVIISERENNIESIDLWELANLLRDHIRAINKFYATEVIKVIEKYGCFFNHIELGTRVAKKTTYVFVNSSGRNKIQVTDMGSGIQQLALFTRVGASNEFYMDFMTPAMKAEDIIERNSRVVDAMIKPL